MTGPNAIGPTEFQAHVDRVRERYELGIVDAEDAASALGRIHLVDADGSAWTVGVRSRSWYRFRDGRWVVAGRAPDPTRLLTAGELLGLCASCGAPSGGGRFCGACGVEQPASRLGADAASGLGSFLESGYDTLPEPLPERPTVADSPSNVVPRSAAAPATPAPAPSAPIVAAPAVTESVARARPSHRRSMRAIVSTVIGAGLLVVSGSRLVIGVVGDPFGLPSASTEPTLASGDGRSDASNAPFAEASAAPDASADPGPTLLSAEPPTEGSTWFSDDFSAEGAWPIGDDGLLGAVYENGWYLLTAHPTDLPVYRWAVHEAAVGAHLVVEASIAFDTSGPTAVGLAVADSSETRRLLVLLEPGGEWTISRDDLEAFETIAAGRAEPVGPQTVHRLRLELDGGGGVSAWLDDVMLGSGAAASLEVAAFGVSVWSVEDGGRVAIDDYRVTVPPTD